VNEADWHSYMDPRVMLQFPQGRGGASDRKMRLFACACVRRAWHLLPGQEGRKAVEVAEAFADGLAGAGELKAAEEDAKRSTWTYEGPPRAASWAATWATLRYAVVAERASRYAAEALAGEAARRARKGGRGARGARVDSARAAARAAEHRGQASLLRDIVGSPAGRPSPLAPSVLAWNDGTVVKLAQAAYDSRALPAGTLDNIRLAVLADALEEAGLTDAGLLAHLRSAGPHVRGCFALDAVLGRS
jgi:hypothetical protein